MREGNRRARLGTKRPEREKQKISATMKGRPSNNRNGAGAEGCRKISESLKAFYKVNPSKRIGSTHTAETKAAMSERNKGNEYAAGTVWTDDMRARLSASQKARRERERAERLRTA